MCSRQSLRRENLVHLDSVRSSSHGLFTFARCSGQNDSLGQAAVFLSGLTARATVAGAGELLYRSSESPATLRENVTSPAGTTLAALQILRPDEGMPSLMRRAVAAAAARSRELAG